MKTKAGAIGAINNQGIDGLDSSARAASGQTNAFLA